MRIRMLYAHGSCVADDQAVCEYFHPGDPVVFEDASIVAANPSETIFTSMQGNAPIAGSSGMWVKARMLKDKPIEVFPLHFHERRYSSIDFKRSDFAAHVALHVKRHSGE